MWTLVRWPAVGPVLPHGNMARKTMETRKISFKEVGSDLLYGKNVLSIVVEIDWAKLLDDGPLFAVVAELTSGKCCVRIERVGRPEIKNVTLSAKDVRPGQSGFGNSRPV